MMNYELKKLPEDFQVLENINLNDELNETGRYHYYYVSKSGFTTFQMAEYLETHLNTPPGTVGYTGLKDEDGVTSQYVSLPFSINAYHLESFNNKYKNTDGKYISAKYFGCGNQFLKIAKLEGNTFKLKVRNLSEEVASKISMKNDYSLSFINYYGGQRFGLPNQLKNTHHIGKALIDKNYNLALNELAKQISKIGNEARFYIGDPQIFFENQTDQRMLAFFQSSHHAHNWNTEIFRYVKESNLLSDKQIIDEIEYHFLLNEDEINKVAKEKSFIENVRVILDNNSFKKIMYNRPTIVKTKIAVEEINNDELNDEKYLCQLSFSLPSGSYATIAIAQFMHKFFYGK